MELPQQEQAILRDIDARYYGANKFTAAAEQRELANQGFPMPEEWLAASRLADEELEQMANAGNIKAGMFYSDRLGSRLMEMQAANIASASSEESQKQLAQLTAKALVSGAQLMRTSNSPFTAYVYGRSLSGASKGAQPEAMAGAFFAARDRGDLRATMLMASFERENPRMNSQTIMAAYYAMATLSAK